MPLKFTASVPGELRFRDLVGVMVREVCRRVERDTECAGLEWRVMSAYNEAFNNIVEHAYEACSGDVEVVLCVEEDQVVLQMADQGQEFDFGASGATGVPPELETLSEGGMGLFIIRQAMSEVTYERHADRNLLTMMKRFADCAPSNGAAHGDTRC